MLERSTILITGSAGQLGRDLADVFSRCGAYRVVAADRARLDVTDAQAARRFIEEVAPHVILHAAAFTDVDACETQPEKAFQVNAQGTQHVAAAAEGVGATFVYISTDYVFDGAKASAYGEEDPACPLNVYGASKLQGEALARAQCARCFIVRTAWLYGLHGGNFVKTMLRLAKEQTPLQVVDDQRGTPTWSRDLARQIEALVNTGFYGTYHASAQGACSWYEFARAIFEECGQAVELAPVDSARFPRPARRPGNSALDNENLRARGLDLMPPWRESLNRFLALLREQVAS